MAEVLEKRLKAARRRSGLTQEQVSERLGVETTTVSFWEQGVRKPGRENLVGLASIYGVSVDYLLGLTEEEPRRPVSAVLRELNARFEALELVELPILGVVPAGEPVMPIEQAGEYVHVPAPLVIGLRQHFALMIAGNSLSDMGIHSGQIAIVDPDAELVDGKVYVVQIDDEVTAKRLYRNNGGLRLEGANGPVEVLDSAEVKSLGRVVGAGSWTEL